MDWKVILTGFLDIVAEVFLFIISIYALIAVFEGTRSYIVKGASRKSIKLIITGSIICIGFSAYSFFVSYTLSDFMAVLDDREYIELPDDWASNIPAEKRHTNSKNLASMYYIEKGKLGSYFDMEGNRIAFCPTEKDISKRSSIFETNCETNFYIDAHIDHAWNWIFNFLVAVFLGWIASKKGFSQNFD